jgi:alkyl sulfatase BDS1-like metallo-beta-lactamase superfamily hydrolase
LPRDDDLILRTARETGTGTVIDGIFEGMRQRSLPEKARNADIRVQWVVRDDAQEYPYAMTIKDSTCQVAPGSIEEPTVTFTLDLLPFLKLIAGQSNGQKLFITGKLKVDGNPMPTAGV